MTAAVSTPVGPPSAVDPRGPRFAAGLTATVLAAVLLLSGTPAGWVLLAAQAVVFAAGAIGGPQASPYATVYRRAVRPHLAAPAELEDVRPLRFAQSVGLGFSLVGLVALPLVPFLGLVAVALAFVAAFLNAAFGLCLGCEVYLLIRRLAPAATTH